MGYVIQLEEPTSMCGIPRFGGISHRGSGKTAEAEAGNPRNAVGYVGFGLEPGLWQK